MLRLAKGGRQDETEHSPRKDRAGLEVDVVGLTVGAPIAAANEANSRESRMGIELAAISPPDTSEEIAGGGPELVREVREVAESFGLPQRASIG